MASLINRFINFILGLAYDKSKSIERKLLLLLAIGFIIRLIAALNLGVLADDMLYASQSAGIIKAGILSTHSNPPLFFYLTDLAYTIFGYTTFASRFFQIILGTLLVLLSYLITKKLFSKEAALSAAFFVTFSTFLTRNTFSEASLLTLFFSFLGVYLGMHYLADGKKRFIIFSAISFGLASLIKYNAPFFILAFLVFSFFYLKFKSDSIFKAPHFKKYILFLAIIFILSMPFLTFNYLLYKDKGITDVYFSRLFPNEKSQQTYAGLGGQENSFVDNLLNPSSYTQLSLPFSTDYLLFIFAILGLILFYVKKEKTPLVFFAVFFAVPFVLQSAGSTLAKHFVFMPFLSSIPAGYFLSKILSKINKKSYRIFFILAVMLLMLLTLGTSHNTPQNLISKSQVSALKSYINTNVEKGSFIIFDPRIYTAQGYWISTPHDIGNFLLLAQISAMDAQTPDKKIQNVYFIECLSDDCGWGTISQQPELNQTAEFLFEQVKNQSKPIKVISSTKYSGNEFLSPRKTEDNFAIYNLQLLWSSNLVSTLKRANVFYFTPYLYKDMSAYFYNYEKHSALDRILEKFARLILYLSIILAILFIFLPWKFI